jgi:D-amino peptidase
MVKRCNVFISFDMEGVGGLTSWEEIRKDSSSLMLMRKLATEEVNAAIRGIRNAHQNIGEITVCDSHANGENLLIDRLEKDTFIIKGTPRNYYMIEGINKHFDILFFLGYHAMVGTPKAGMDHSYSSRSIYNIRINNKCVGETEINAAVAGFYKVPLGLVTGDDQLAKEVRKFFGRAVEFVITKYGISRTAAKCRHPYDIQKEIETKAEQAIKKSKQLKPFIFRQPIRVEIDVSNTLIADTLSSVPGIKRRSGRTLVFQTKNILEFYRMLRVICNLANTAL